MIYNKPTRCNSGSIVFINNYKYALHDKHQWLLLQFIVLLMMDAKRVRNIWSILVVVNKHSTAKVASCWFIIYYRLVMHGNSNVKYGHGIVVNKHNTARVASCWFIIYYRLVMHGNWNVKYGHGIVVNKHNTARVASCWFITYYKQAHPFTARTAYIPTA